jgi:DedD protein
MDQGLKERLVGAAVLVAIGVWLIPWVLNGPDNAVETEPASLQLPAAEEPVPMRTQTLRLGEPDAAAPTAEGRDSSEGETVVAAASPSVEPAPAAVAEPPVAKPAPAAKTQSPAPVESVAPAPTKPVSRTTAATPKGDWTVQLGSFSEEANARRLAEKVSTFGHKPTVSSYRASGKTLYRVRVGAYDVKGQAEATASALSAHGLTAKVVPAN